MENKKEKAAVEKGKRLSALKIEIRKHRRMVYAVTLMLSVISIADVLLGGMYLPVDIFIYVCAALALILSCVLGIKTFLSRIRELLTLIIEKSRILTRISRDDRLRIILMTLPGLGINIVFAVFNGVVGILSRSAWYGSLSAYYLILCAMRFVSVSYARQLYSFRPWERQNFGMKRETSRDVELREITVYRNCGILMSVMSITIVGAVLMLVIEDGGKSYPGFLIYAVAAYAFSKLAISFVNVVRARREQTILVIVLRNIGHVDALLSILSLQTALLAAFGTKEDAFIPTMNAFTGGIVSVAALVIGIYMIVDSGRRRKKWETGS